MSKKSPKASDESSATRNIRLGVEDWAQGALEMIADAGVAGIAIEPLARRLGVTKGSFYWHFKSRNELLKAALERWETVSQEHFFEALEVITDPRARLRALFQSVAREVNLYVIYSGLLKVPDHPAVRPIIERMSQQRMGYLVDSFRQAGLSQIDAQHRAHLAYTAYVGFLQLSSLQLQEFRLTHEGFDAYVEHVIATLIP